MDEFEESNIFYANNFESFTINIVTTAKRDIPFWDASNRILEIVVRHLRTDQVYHSIFNIGDEIIIPEVSINDSTISRDIVRFNGRDASSILQDLLKFIELNSEGKRPLLFTHDMFYVTNMLCKELHLELGMDSGKSYCLLPFDIFDIELFAEKNLPELFFVYGPNFQPHSLATMTKHYGIQISYYKLMRALGASESLKQLLENVILPLLADKYEIFKEWPYLLQNIVAKNLTLERHVKTIPGLDEDISQNLYTIVHEYLEDSMSDNYEMVHHSHGLFVVADLLMYASYRLRQAKSKLTGEQGLVAALRAIELLLRCKEVCIESDIIIVSVLASVCQMTDFDFIFHRSVSSIEAFPTIRQQNGICFKPLKVSSEDAIVLGKKFNIWSITQLYARYSVLDAIEQTNFISALDRSLQGSITLKQIENAISIYKQYNYQRLKDFKANNV